MPRRRPRLALQLTTREGTTRLEALSDGVFAIAATLLVVDLKAPRGISDSSELLFSALWFTPRTSAAWSIRIIAFVVAWWSPRASAILIMLAALFYLLPIHLTTRD